MPRSASTLPPLHDGTGQFDLQFDGSCAYDSASLSTDVLHSEELDTDELDFDLLADDDSNVSSLSPSVLPTTQDYERVETLPADPLRMEEVQDARAISTPLNQQGRSGTADQDKDSVSDAAFDEELASTPFAISAGLNPSRAGQSTRADRRSLQGYSISEVSSSEISAGIKRRHRRQHICDEGSARSSKSRRGDRRAVSTLASVSSAGSTSTHQSRRVRRVQQQDSSSAPADPSRKQRASKLLSRLFDIDDDVLDCVLEDKGPLALEQEERDLLTEGPSRYPRIGLDHHLEYCSDEEDDDSAAYPSADGEGNDARSVPVFGSSQPHYSVNPISALSKADQWRSQTESPTTLPSEDAPAEPGQHHLSSPTIQDALKYTVGQLHPGDQSAALVLLSGGANALQGMVPYFVPFTWRLLMRAVRDWQGADKTESEAVQRDQRHEYVSPPPAASRPRSNTVALTENEIASLESSSQASSAASSATKIEQWRRRSDSAVAESFVLSEGFEDAQ